MLFHYVMEIYYEKHIIKIYSLFETVFQFLLPPMTVYACKISMTQRFKFHFPLIAFMRSDCKNNISYQSYISSILIFFFKWHINLLWSCSWRCLWCWMCPILLRSLWIPRSRYLRVGWCRNSMVRWRNKRSSYWLRRCIGLHNDEKYKKMQQIMQNHWNYKTFFEQQIKTLNIILRMNEWFIFRNPLY